VPQTTPRCLLPAASATSSGHLDRRPLVLDRRRQGKGAAPSAAKTRELLTSGGYVLKRIRLRTNLPLERQAAQVTQPSSRRARYYTEAGPVTKGGYKHGI
jgi:hypothetical protein